MTQKPFFKSTHEMPAGTTPSHFIDCAAFSKQKVQQALKGLLDRIKEEAQEIAELLSPQTRRPALQPVPVQRPVRRKAR